METNAETLPVQIITFNIRYATTDPGPGEEPWSVRCPALCSLLKNATSQAPSTFLCLQEVLHQQLLDILQHLGPEWEYIGRGRGTQPTQEEYSPILYRPTSWTCSRHDTRWLSEEQTPGSIGWDAACPRIVTMGEFSHVTAQTSVVVMSTHLDHQGKIARAESAKMLVKLAAHWGSADHVATCLVGGDFNSTPDDTAYVIMTGNESKLADISRLVKGGDGRPSTEITFTGFRGEGEDDQECIDYLFIGLESRATVDRFRVIGNQVEGIVVSDHRPLVADLTITTKRS